MRSSLFDFHVGILIVIIVDTYTTLRETETRPIIIAVKRGFKTNQLKLIYLFCTIAFLFTYLIKILSTIYYEYFSYL